MINVAMAALVQEGAATLGDVPYNQFQCGATSRGPYFQLDGFSRVPAADGVSIRGAIQMMQPVSFGMLVDDRFQALSQSNPIYVPSGSGGGHALTVIGYDNVAQRYRIMNSWGNQWGDNGTFWMSYADFARHAMDVCIPYLRRAANNELLSASTSNAAIPVIAQHMNGRRYGTGTPGSYGAGVEMAWSAPVDISSASLAVLDNAQNLLFEQQFSVRQIARGIRFGSRLPDAAANFVIMRSSVNARDSSGARLVLTTYTRPYSR